MPRISLIALLIVFLSLGISSQAQSTQLLQNPGFEGSGYVDQRPADSTEPFAIAPNWNGWYTRNPRTASWMNIDPIAFPHTGSFKQSGDRSQNIGRGDATFTAALYQTIPGITEGTSLRFSVWVFQDSEAGSGSQTRVGIGSNVGGNPLGSPITWSNWMTSIDSWQQITVDATVPSGTVTVFIYSTQSVPKPANQNYYDDASLTVTGGGGQVNVGDGQSTGTPNVPPPPTSTPRVFAPSVAAQPTQEGGRIEHTVNSGDTLAAISVAYGVPIPEILELNGLTNETARFLRVGQVLLISEGDPNPPTETPIPTVEEPVFGTPADEETGSGFASPTPQEVAQEPTAEATEEASATPENSPTPSDTPTPTEIPPTPTDAPPAPVEEGEESDPLNIEAGICLLMFDDSNRNNLRDGEESALEGGIIRITNAAGEVIETITDGTDEQCLDELPAGVYTVNATAPDGYGLPRSVLSLSVQAGQAFTISFAAVEGFEVAAVPTVSTSVETPTEIVEEASAEDNLRNIAGIIVLGLAGVILVGGIGVAFFMRNR